MARLADDLSEAEANALGALFVQLKSFKPAGWSIVQGDRELVIRPYDRGLGKFGVTIFRSRFRIAFFSPSLNHWDGDSHFDFTEDCAGPMLKWAQTKFETERARLVSVEISILGPDDHSKLADVLPDVFDYPVRDTLVSEFLDDPRHHMAVATRDGRVVGIASAVHYIHPDKDAELLINEVSVSSTHRRAGIGKALVRALLNLARDLRCREAWVLAEGDNTAAIRLYESLGGAQPSKSPAMFSFVVDPNSQESDPARPEF